MITFLAMETKVRFMGVVEGVAAAVVGAVVVEALAEDWQILGVKLLGEVESDVVFKAGEDGLVGRVSTPGESFNLSGEQGLSGLDMVWADFGEEWEFFLGSVVISVEDGDLASWDGGADRSLEMDDPGICLGEGLSSTGLDPWVLTGVGVDGKSFSILKAWEEKKWE